MASAVTYSAFLHSIPHCCLCAVCLRPTTSSNLLLHCPPRFALAKCRGCAFATQTCQINGKRNHSICHPPDLNFTVCVWRRAEKKLERRLTSLKNQSALCYTLTGKGIHTHSAAIVGSKMTNHNIIDVLKRLQTTVPLTTFAPIQRERVNLIMMTGTLFQAPFQASSSWGWKSKRWDESSPE